MVKCVGMLADDSIGQRDVCGDDQITFFYHLYNEVVCFVCTLLYEVVLDMRGFADSDLFVCDDYGRESQSLYGFEDDRLEEIGKGISIDKEPQETISLTLPTSLVSSRTLIP